MAYMVPSYSPHLLHKNSFFNVTSGSLNVSKCYYTFYAKDTHQSLTSLQRFITLKYDVSTEIGHGV